MGEEAEFTEMLGKLEEEEIMCSSGIPSDEVYEKMLALYLLKNDTIQAKLLWKRIPAAAKTRSADLGKLWEVGKLMYERKRSLLGKQLAKGGWGGAVAPLMAALNAKHTEQTLALVAKAYQSIGFTDLTDLLNMSVDEMVERVSSLGWGVDRGAELVTPAPAPDPATATSMESDKQLHRLAMYVSFLERGL